VVRTSTAGILLVRTPYDSNWRATIDGRDAAVFPADYVDQGVSVPGGRHLVVLRYDDPTIGYGLLGSSVSLLALLGGAAALSFRRRRPPPGTQV